MWVSLASVTFSGYGLSRASFDKLRANFINPRPVRWVMSRCVGEIAIGTKVDRPMKEFVESECERLGVSRSEFHRRLLDVYRESRRENVDCPHCDDTIMMDLTQ